MSVGMLVLAAILVSEAGAGCEGDTCKPGGVAVGFYGTVYCPGSGAVDEGVPVCFFYNGDANWGETCFTDTAGNYYLYPKYVGIDSCDFAPSGTTYSAWANACNYTRDCWKSKPVTWNGGLQKVDFILTMGPCTECP
jgi:hypothetical protein